MEEVTLRATCWRVFDGAHPGAYLISIYTNLAPEKNRVGLGLSCHHMPQAWAVMDEFGDLVIVRGWL